MPLETNTGVGELVEVRRLDFGVVIADVPPAEIVGDDDDDVRLGLFAGVGVRRAKDGRRHRANVMRRIRAPWDGWALICTLSRGEFVGKNYFNGHG